MITEDYVSFETSKLLKEKGFDWRCHATYDTAVTGGKPKFNEYEVLSFFPFGMKNSDDKYSMVISAPTLQMAMKWLRRKYGLFIRITEDMTGNVYEWSVYQKNYGCRVSTYVEDSYEQAEETAIKYCLENLI